jgi:pSer/pThr/pTyr-binding forkhead associated (FHA) protein
MQHDNTQAAEPQRAPPPVFCLKGLSGATTGKSFPLAGDTFIGRRHECQIVLNAPGISRQHAKIGFSNGRYYLQDMASANGTFVNGIRIETILLSPGDEIAFDNIRFVFKAISGGVAEEESSGLQSTLRRDLRSRFQRKPPPEPDTEPATKIAAPPSQTLRRKGWIIGLTALLMTLLVPLLAVLVWLLLRH